MKIGNHALGKKREESRNEMTTTYEPKKELTEFKNICEGLLKAIDLDFSEADFELHHTGIAEKHAELYAHTFGKNSFFEKLLKHIDEITLNQWQDISDCPKDGTKFDMWHPVNGRFCNAQWGEAYGCPIVIWPDGTKTLLQGYTHFMQIPTAPTLTEN